MNKSDNIIKELEQYKTQLKGFKDKAEKTKLQRVSNESKLEMLRRTEADVVNKIEILGYKPDNLKDHIVNKMKELKEITEKLDAVMPDENGLLPKNAAEILGVTRPTTAVIDEETSVESLKTIVNCDTKEIPEDEDFFDGFDGIDFADMPI